MEDRREPEAGVGDLDQLRDELSSLRRRAVDDAALISELESERADAERIERAQRALIARLRAEAGDATHEFEAVSESLAAAARELGDLRAIRDALASPAFVQRDGLSIAAQLTPAEAEVGGDFFYVGDGPGGVVTVAVGDVVGKGLRAARRAAFTRTALASVAPFSDDPGQLLRWVNVALVERIGEGADFVTAICCTCDPRTRELRIAAAGHHPALRLGSGEELAGARDGAALGLAEQIASESRAETLAPGTGVLLFTDGIIEARGAESRYGSDRLRDAVRRSSASGVDDLLSELTADLADFRAPGPIDDVCLVALRVD